MSKTAKQQGTVSALKRGIAVLHCFSNGARTLSNAEISALTKVPKPTVTRLATTLVSLGLMRQDPETEKYSLGAGVLSLAQTFLSNLDIRAHARPHLRHLADTTGGSVFLGICDGLEMVVIEACRPQSSMVTVRLDVGSRLSISNSALGRAYKGSLDSPGIEISLRAEVNAIAAALTLPGGERMAISCGGPTSKFPESRLRDEVAPLLLATTRAIAHEIGGFVRQPEHQAQAA